VYLRHANLLFLGVCGTWSANSELLCPLHFVKRHQSAGANGYRFQFPSNDQPADGPFRKIPTFGQAFNAEKFWLCSGGHFFLLLVWKNLIDNQSVNDAGLLSRTVSHGKVSMNEASRHKMNQFLPGPLKREEKEGIVVKLVNFPLPQRGSDLGREELVRKRIEERNRLEPTNEQLDEIEAVLVLRQPDLENSRQAAYDEYWKRLKPELPDEALMPPRGWSPDEAKAQTAYLQSITKDYWPELWLAADPWEVVDILQKYLRLFWRASEDNKTSARDWYLQRARQYCRELQIMPELQRTPEGMPRLAKRKWLLDIPPTTPIDSALRHLQDRAAAPGSRPRICKMEDCKQPYFLPRASKGQIYCAAHQAEQVTRDRASKRKSRDNNKDKWPSTAKRRKDRG
jgi:hypothetical protein